MAYYWRQIEKLTSKNYTCGHCGSSVASDMGYNQAFYEDGSGDTIGHIYICHHCLRPTFFDIEGGQTPGELPGEDVSGIDEASVENLYKEARNAFSSGAFTATVLSCRKLLMHVAVSKGAEEGQNFITYVSYLADNNHIPPGSKDWVDHIRDKGNEANHEIAIMTKEEAEELLSFVTMLLKLAYEFPSKMRKHTSGNTTS